MKHPCMLLTALLPMASMQAADVLPGYTKSLASPGFLYLQETGSQSFTPNLFYPQTKLVKDWG